MLRIVWSIHRIRGLRTCFKGSTGKICSKAIVSSYLTLNKLLNLFAPQFPHKIVVSALQGCHEDWMG